MVKFLMKHGATSVTVMLAIIHELWRQSSYILADICVYMGLARSARIQHTHRTCVLYADEILRYKFSVHQVPTTAGRVESAWNEKLLHMTGTWNRDPGLLMLCQSSCSPRQMPHDHRYIFNVFNFQCVPCIATFVHAWTDVWVELMSLGSSGWNSPMSHRNKITSITCTHSWSRM